MTDWLKVDPRIEEVSDERKCGNGYFVYLKPGWAFGGTGEAHCFTEDTIKDIRESMKAVKVCECDECISLLKGEQK